MLNHIIWDWNGTLLDDAWLCTDIMNDLLTKYNLPTITLEKYREIFDFPVKDYYEKTGFDFSKLSFEKMGTEFIEIYNKRKKECKLQPDTVLVLQHFYDNGVPQSILSARQQKDLIDDINYYGLKKYFTHISGLKNHYADGKIKNAEKLLEKIGEKHSDVLIIGDTTHDFEIAKKFRLKRIMLSHGHHSKGRFKKYNVVVYDNLYKVTHPL